MEIRDLDPADLDLSLGRLRQVPESAVRAMVSSWRSKGQLSPLVAAKGGARLVLVDGFARQAAARRLGLRSVKVEVVELSTAQMKAQVYLRNRERGLLLVEECRLVGELHDQDGLNQVQIGDLLERHKSWVCRRLQLQRELSPRLLEDLSLGLLGAGSLRRLAQLPARNQEELVAVARRDGLSPRDTSALIDLWRRTSDPEARCWLIDHPGDALSRARGHRDEVCDPRLTEAARHLMAALITLSAASLRLRHRLEQGLGEMRPEAIELIAVQQQRSHEHCREAFSALAAWRKTKEEVHDQGTNRQPAGHYRGLCPHGQHPPDGSSTESLS